MNELQIFESADFGRVRTIEIDGEAWFVGKDVATALGYKDTDQALRTHVDNDDKLTRNFDGTGQNRAMTVINESGLYALIFGSKLESAKKFKHWVTSEVLPAIRKTGGYKMPQTTGEKIVLLAQGYTELQQEINEVRADVHQLKMDLPILPIDAERITEAVRARGTEVLGGKDSMAYNDKSLRSRLYSNLYSTVKYNFGVRSYKSIKRSQCDRAIEIIKGYIPPYFLETEIRATNTQYSIG